MSGQLQRIADQAQLILDHRLIVDHQSRGAERGEFARYPAGSSSSSRQAASSAVRR
jgi:hypothetical protein